MSLEIKDSSLAIKKIKHEWEPLPVPVRGAHRALEADKIYIFAKENIVKSHKLKSIYLTIYVGAEIMELLGLHVKDRVKLLIDKNNPNYLRIAKSDDANGYLIGKASKTSTSHVTFRYTGLLMLKPSKTVDVEFDLFSDQSFMVDLSKLKARQGINYATN